MDGRRFDAIVRTLVSGSDSPVSTGISRRGLLAGLAGLVAAWQGHAVRRADAACPPEQIRATGGRCVCRTTGRPPDAAGLCPCARGRTQCDGACVQTETDAAHCGSCGLACAPNESCRSGGCVCLPACDGQPCGAADGCGGFCTTGSCPAPTECQESVVCNQDTGGCDVVNRPPGFPCGASAACVDGVATPAGACDGAGGCQPGRPVPCAPYACGPTACLTECTDDDDCADCAECQGDSCLPPPATLLECLGRCEQLPNQIASVIRCGRSTPCPSCGDCPSLGCSSSASALGTVGDTGALVAYCITTVDADGCFDTSECEPDFICRPDFVCSAICYGP